MFVTKRLDDTWTNWSEPENLGKHINTPNWDGYFNIPASGKYAYFSSTSESIGQYDIFRIRLTPEIKPEAIALVTGQVFDKETNKPISATIKSAIRDSLSAFTTTSYHAADDNYQLFLPLHSNYVITVDHENYFTTAEEINLTDESNFREIKLNLYLQPVKTGQQIRLSSSMFAQSSAQIMEHSFDELNRIVKIMKQYSSMKILLEGHTDNQGDTQKNIELSQQRVEEVKNYLTKQGIDSSRIETKAWGPAKPITNNLTEQSRQKNRRVEFTILNI